MEEMSDCVPAMLDAGEEGRLCRYLIENTLEAVVLIQNRRFLMTNKAFCRLSGYSKAEVMQLGVCAVFATEDIEQILSLTAIQSDNHREYAGFRHKSGRCIQVELNVTTVQISGHDASFLSIRDITRRKQMENSLRESEAKYKTLVENSQDGIVIVRDNRILFANTTTCRMLEYKRRELYALNAIELVHPEDIGKMQYIADRRHSSDFSTLHHKMRLISKSGKVRICEMTASFIDFQGVKANFFTQHDVTERIRIEQELHKSELKYNELADMLPMAVYELDVNGMPVFMNKTGLKLLGLNRPDYYNRPATSYFLPSDQKTMEEKLADESRRMIRRNGKVEPIASAPVEYTVCRPDGTLVPVIIYGTAIVENNKIVGSRGVMVDISERKAMENALRESERKYRELSDFMPQTLYELDEQLNLVYMNKSGKEAFGLTDADYGKLNLSYFIDADRPLVAENLQTLMDGKRQEFMCEYTVTNVRGDQVPVISYSLPIYQDGKIVGVRGMAIDISERKASEQALRESEQKYRELAEMLPQTVYELDRLGNIQYLNKTGRDKFGSDYENTPVSVFSFVHAEHKARMEFTIQSIKSNTIPDKGYYYTLQQKDGRTFEAMISAAPVVVNGVTLGSRGVMIDISDHMAMQKALAESEEKHRQLIENATDGIVIVQNGALQFANQAMCDMLKYDLDELIETPLLAYIDKEDPELFYRVLEQEPESNRESNIFRTCFIRKDSRKITVELNARIFDLNGSPAEFIVVRDLTERLKIETELQIAKTELEKLNGQLEKRVIESSKRLAEARTQLINLQKENLQSQYDVLKQQVNPHFLFNSLNVLTSLIKLEPDLAERFSEQLSKVYRYVLENRDNELVDLNTELSFLNAYIFLLNIRFMDKLQVRMDIPDEKRSYRIIPLAMQLLIENAIKHNVMSKSKPLVIDVFIDADDCLHIVNNLQERPSQVTSTGVGLKNILNRYQLLSLPLPLFDKSAERFVAKIPLVRNE